MSKFTLIDRRVGMARLFTIDELEQRWPKGRLHSAGKGRGMKYAYFVVDKPSIEEQGKIVCEFAGTYLDHGGKRAPLRVYMGARTAEGWDPIG